MLWPDAKLKKKKHNYFLMSQHSSSCKFLKNENLKYFIDRGTVLRHFALTLEHLYAKAFRLSCFYTLDVICKNTHLCKAYQSKYQAMSSKEQSSQAG